jgi:hypothetical protein
MNNNTFDERLTRLFSCFEREKKIIRKKWNFVKFFELSATFRWSFDISLVKRNLKIINSKKYQKYLIWFAEIKMIIFLNALIISILKRDFWSSFFFDTANANLNDISTYNDSNAVNKTFKLIDENEIKKRSNDANQTMHRNRTTFRVAYWKFSWIN